MSYSMLRRFRITLRDFFADKEVRFRVALHNFRHSAKIDPYKLYYIDPSEVTEAMEAFDRPKRSIAGKVIGGSWDKKTRKFTQFEGDPHFHVYESFKKKFCKGVPWKDTEFYRKLLSEVENGRYWWGCKSKNDIEKRCEKIEELYKNIKYNGYKTQSELIESKEYSDMKNADRAEVYTKINGEVAICVGRNGELIFYDGRNRLALAKILNIDEIPVVILARHKKWQDTRENIARDEIEANNIKMSPTDHPDLVNL